MKTIIIHHSADFDGIFCREIAHRFLPDAQLIGWDYGDPIPDIPEGTHLYMMDISVDGLMNFPGLIWIDHHKSAIEKFDKNIAGYRIDGVAACRLAWQWFMFNGEPSSTKEHFIGRIVSEPIAVRLAGEYDIWDKRDPKAELFQYGLRSQPLSLNDWRFLLGTDCAASVSEGFVNRLLNQGACLYYAKTEENEGIIKSYGFDVEFGGLKFLACNHVRFNSQLFTAGLKPEHDALLGFNWSGKDWRVSLYHAPGKEHHDLSVIAVKYGGGGHRGACGFRTNKLQFLQP